MIQKTNLLKVKKHPVKVQILNIKSYNQLKIFPKNKILCPATKISI